MTTYPPVSDVGDSPLCVPFTTPFFITNVAPEIIELQDFKSSHRFVTVPAPPKRVLPGQNITVNVRAPPRRAPPLPPASRARTVASAAPGVRPV